MKLPALVLAVFAGALLATAWIGTQAAVQSAVLINGRRLANRVAKGVTGKLRGAASRRLQLPSANPDPVSTTNPLQNVVDNVNDAPTDAANTVADGLNTFTAPDAQGNSLCDKPENKQWCDALSTQNQMLNNIGRIVVSLVIGAIYYVLIASKYPKLKYPTDESKEMQSKSEITGLCESSLAICFCSCFCGSARAAHTFDATETCGYWPGLLLMTIFPCCTLMYTNGCTDMNEKLGGQKQSIVMACLCAFFCAPCLIAKDAQSLDYATGATTTCCGVVPGDEDSSADE